MEVGVIVPVIWRYVLARLREASTWKGIILMFASGWATQNPEQLDAVITAALAFVGLIGTIFPDVAPGAKRRIDDNES